MTVTREQVAHLRDGDHVTVKFTGYGNIEDPVTSVLREHYGELRLAGGYTVRMKNGDPNPELAEVVLESAAEPAPLPPEPVREPGWYLVAAEEFGVVCMYRHDGKGWLNMYGNPAEFPEPAWELGASRVADLDGSPVPAQAPAPCGRRHVQPSEVVIDLDAVETSFLRTVADAVGDELEHRAAEIRASL